MTPKPAAYRLNQRISFVDLPQDIHHLIVAEVTETSPSTLPSLVRVSKAIGEIATPYIYQNFVIRKVADDQEALDALLEKVRGENGGLCRAKHIRHLIVEEDIGSNRLVEMLDCIDNLKRFSWNMSAIIPPKVLEKIHTAFPSARISVCNHNRHTSYPSSHQDMDLALLASPQLDRLDYTVYVDSQNYNVVSSEWPQLTSALQAGGNCKSLRLEISSYHDLNIPDSGGPARFRLGPGSVLPPLEEFSLCRSQYWGEYGWDIPHCELLKASLDWSRMRVVDFGSDCPMLFFEAMAGFLPNLKSLTFQLPQAEEPLGTVPGFLETLPGLEALRIGNLVPHVEAMWPIIKKHSATLESLVVLPCRSPYTFPMYLDIDFWTSFRTDFPHIKHLGIDVPFSQEKKGLKGTVIVNKLAEDHMTALMQMPLQTLDFFLHLPDGHTSFAGDYKPNVYGSSPFPALNKAGCKNTGAAIADTVSSQRGHTLQTMNLNLSRTGYEDRFQPYLMSAKVQLKKSDRDDAEQLTQKDKWKVVEKECIWNWGMPMW